MAENKMPISSGELEKSKNRALDIPGLTEGFDLGILSDKVIREGVGIDPQKFYSAYAEFKKKGDNGAIPGLDEEETKTWAYKILNGVSLDKIPPKWNTKAMEDIAYLARNANPKDINPEFENVLRQELQRVKSEGRVSDEDILSTAAQISGEIRKDFNRDLGREPTQAEVAAIFNKLEFSDQTFAFPSDKVENIRKDLLERSTYSSLMKDYSEKLPVIEAAQDDLKNIGETLSTDDISKVLGKAITPERADLMIAEKVKAKKDAYTMGQVEVTKGKQNVALDELNRTLAKQQGEYLVNDIFPAITKAIRDRGLLVGPELQTVLSEAAAKLGREREAMIAPMRAGVNVGAPETAFNLAVSAAQEAGRNVGTAKSFLQGLGVLGKEQTFTAQQSALDRIFQQQKANEQSALLMAMMGRGSKEPTGLDYFLQYGLPTITQLASAKIGKG